MNFGIVILLVLIIFILFVQMVLSAIAADNANSKNVDDLQKAKTCSTAAAVTAGLSVLGLVVFLILYIMNTGQDSKFGEESDIREAALQDKYITKPQVGFYEDAKRYENFDRPENINNDNNRVDLSIFR